MSVNWFSFQFNFTRYLRDVYALSNVTLNDNDVVSVSEIAFLRNASDLLSRTSQRTIQNYFVWRFMMSRAGIMPRDVRNIRDRFDRVFRGTSAERPRSITCANYVNNNMGFAVAKVFITRYFDETARSQVRIRADYWRTVETFRMRKSRGLCRRTSHSKLDFDLVPGNDWEHSKSLHWNGQKFFLDGWNVEDKSYRKSKQNMYVQHPLEMFYFRRQRLMRRSAIQNILAGLTSKN